MIDIDIKIDDRQIQRFIKDSPARADWSLKEGIFISMASARKKMVKVLEKGFGKDLHPLTTHEHGKLSPLQRFAKLVRFKVTTSKGIIKGRVGFLVDKKKGTSASVTKTARKLIYGKRERIRDWKKMRYKMGKAKVYIKKTTKFITTPARDFLTPFWQREKRTIENRVEKEFFNKFFSKEKPELKI